MVRKVSILITAAVLSLCGCEDPVTYPKVVQVPMTPAPPSPAPEMIEGYELEVLDLSSAKTWAECVRQPIQAWLETHRDRKIVSIIPIPHGGDCNPIENILIVSYKTKPVEAK